MEKKNPYVTTIGFNRKDPNHRKVAEFLNEMGRGKAQYIVNAMLAYQKEGDQSITEKGINYESIRKIVKELIAENRSKAIYDENEGRSDLQDKMKKEESNLKEIDINNILYSISLFKK